VSNRIVQLLCTLGLLRREQPTQGRHRNRRAVPVVPPPHEWAPVPVVHSAYYPPQEWEEPGTLIRPRISTTPPAAGDAVSGVETAGGDPQHDETDLVPAAVQVAEERTRLAYQAWLTHVQECRAQCRTGGEDCVTAVLLCGALREARDREAHP
jgi:hypothetical protein